jgi:DNA-binding SARP family transcriptional activator
MDIRLKLEEQRIDALELKFEAELALGRHRAMISELLGLVTAHPLRERLWELLMIALFRAGRQAEALDTYRRVHRLLGDELGIRPGVQLSSLQRRILAGDVDLLGALAIPVSS